MRRSPLWPATLIVVSTLFLAGCEPELLEMARGVGGLSFCGLIVLVLDVIAIVEVAGSSRTLGGKLIWTLFILFFPVVGLIIYYLFAERN